MDPNLHLSLQRKDPGSGCRLRIKIEKIPSTEGIPGTG